MKNYNKILEAVNRGIQLALDDFNDVDQVQNIKSKQVQNRDYTKEYLNLMNEVVDLALPSGTLWAKYNLGVDPNQLSNAEDWYGKYYAWGELESNKSEFSWSTYKYAEHYTDLFETDCLTKYCNNPRRGYNQITKRWGFTDNLTELLPEDDAAYQNKNKHIGNFKFHIPTKEQYEELINYTNNYWINNYDPNKLVHNPKDDNGIQGLNGSVFEGKNGKQLFVPAAGYRSNESDVYGASSITGQWSSTLFLDPVYAYYLHVGQDRIITNAGSRYIGFSIRPVIKL